MVLHERVVKATGVPSRKCPGHQRGCEFRRGKGCPVCRPGAGFGSPEKSRSRLDSHRPVRKRSRRVRPGDDTARRNDGKVDRIQNLLNEWVERSLVDGRDCREHPAVTTGFGALHTDRVGARFGCRNSFGRRRDCHEDGNSGLMHPPDDRCLRDIEREGDDCRREPLNDVELVFPVVGIKKRGSNVNSVSASVHGELGSIGSQLRRVGERFLGHKKVHAEWRRCELACSQNLTLHLCRALVPGRQESKASASADGGGEFRSGRAPGHGGLDNWPFQSADIKEGFLRGIHMSSEAPRGSFRAVAEATMRSTSSVSQQLRLLDRESGMPLTERVGRGLRLTDAGRALADSADRVAVAMAESQAVWDEFRHRPTGTVTLLSFPSAARLILPPLLLSLEKRPELQVVCQDRIIQEEEFVGLTTDFDVVIAHSNQVTPAWQHADLTVFPLFTEPFDIALPSTTGWLAPNPSTLRTLRARTGLVCQRASLTTV